MGAGRSWLSVRLGQQLGRHHMVIGPLTRSHDNVENCADVFALAAARQRARAKTLNVVDGPGERIWRYLSDKATNRASPLADADPLLVAM